jgi:GNAT superfamily N-acetyltransferase
VPEVRRAGKADAEAVTDCQTVCWREAYAGLVSDAYLYSDAVERRRLDRWRERLAGSRDVWVAEADARVIGVASAGPARDEPPPAPAELMSLYLRASHHGTGLADRLLHVAVGAGAAYLWVFAANRRARSFNARRGFLADGASKLDPDTGVPEIRMVRR